MANPSTSINGRQPGNLKGKRKKVVPTNANPLFTKWITEWKDEAIEKGWKSQYNYAKALRTIKMFPLRLETGKDCKMLQNFGDKICKMLDEKLEEYKRDQDKGIVDDIHVSNPVTSSEPHPSGPNHQPTKNPSAERASTIHTISDNSDSGREETASPKKKKKRQASGTRSREYVPTYRSGPYALLLTLYRYSLDPDYKGFMTKAELMHEAQPLSDKSFTVPDPGSHYTAWSSMSTLIKKILVLKIGNPAKYHLTQEGADLGERLENAERGMETPQTSNVGMDDGCGRSQTSRQMLSPKTVQHSSPTSAATAITSTKVTTSLDHLDHLNLSAEERAFLLEGMTGDVNPTSSVTKPISVQKVFDVSMSDDFLDLSAEERAFISEGITNDANPTISAAKHVTDKNAINDNLVCISDDEEIIDSNSHRIFSPSKLSKAHSLSPSMSPPSSPEFGTFGNEERLVDNINDSGNGDMGVNDSVCLMGYDDDDTDDADANMSGVSQQSPPLRLRLPSLSPSTSVKQVASNDDSVIEIDDDDNDNFTNNISHKHSINKGHLPFSQVSDSSEVCRRKNIFSNVSQSSSQNSQSDDDNDDLPDLDLSIPLSKRLFDKGVTSSQLLNEFNPDLKKSNVFSATGRKCEQLSSSGQSKEIVILDDDDPGPIISKPPTPKKDTFKCAENSQKISSNCRITSSSAETALQARNPEGMELPSESHHTPEFTLLPGTYEIVLCVDNREFYGSKSNSKTLLPDLMQSGVNCDLRLLHIGDIVWVAREIGPPNEDPNRSNRKELVLNFAVERKRMDDLVSSITGGRLKEQKFRLKHSGISELIILIEEYGSIQNFSISEDRIKQSIINSQIIDGFKVKRCGSSKEAVMYLSVMTRFMQKYYGNKTLHAASHEYVKTHASRATVNDTVYHLMPFEMFNETSMKHKAMTVKELFGKQLIQIPGVSLERACAITKVYPTLVSLMSAYNNCTSEKSKESLLSTIKCGNKERNLGIAVSRMMYMLYNTRKLS